MELHHKDRPRMGEKPCYLSGKSVIQAFQVMPLDETVVQMSIMLPVVEAKSVFSFVWFRRKVRYNRIADVFESFLEDPEGCLTDMFGKGGFMTPNIYPPKPRKAITARTRQRVRLKD